MKLRSRILIPIVALVLTLGATFAYFVTGKAGDQLLAKETERALGIVQTLAQMAVGDSDVIEIARFQERLHRSGLLESPDLVYVVLSGYRSRESGTFGGPIPRRAEEPYEWSSPLDSPPVQRSCSDEAFPDIQEFIAPVASFGRSFPTHLLGTVKIGVSFAPIYAERRRLFLTIGILGGLIMIGGIGIANYLSKSITEPLEGLIEGLEAFGRGDLNRRIDILSADEIGALGSSFNQMAEKLRMSRAKIENYSRDLEEMVRARTAELRRAYDELKRLDELKDTFLSSVSHELRTPLTSIHSFVEILQQYGDEDPATRQEFLGIIKRETERLSRLIDDVLDLAKIEAGMASWKVDRHDLRRIVEDAIAAIRPLLDASRITVQLSFPPRIPQILGDRDRLSQVITNLLSNARKFTKAGDTIEVRLKVDSGFVRCEFEDHGVGIAAEHLEKVFEKFRQVENDTLTEKPKGTGLGLPISRDIIEFHGGRMWAESEVGKGATFIFTIPTADNPEPRPISKYAESAV